MLDFLTFKKGHLDFFEPNAGYEGYAEAYMEFMDSLGVLGQAGSHFIDGKIVYISAFWEQVPGNWEVLVIPSRHLPSYALRVVRDVRMWLKVIREKKKARRIQTWGEPNDLIDKWLTVLGFTCEGTMRQYSSEGDKRIWAIVWPLHSQQP